MNTRYLFPNRFKKFGWILLGIGIIYLFCIQYYLPRFTSEIYVLSLFKKGGPGFSINNIVESIQDLMGIFAIVGAIFVAFSKVKNEDEYISKIRLESLLWATYTNYALLILAIIFVYGIDFFSVMVFNMITILIIFIIRFNYILYKTRKTARNEK